MFKEVILKESQNTYSLDNSSVMDELLIEKCIRECDLIQNKLSKLNEYKSNGDFDNLFTYARRLIASSQKLVQMIREIPINYGDKEGYHYLKNELSGAGIGDGIGDSSRIRLSYRDNVLHIVFKDLLPRRSQNGKIYENLDYIRCSYIEAFAHFFSDKNIFFEERVIILYKHYFNNEKSFIDDDNFDYKIITDLIAQYCMIDDNPKRCMKVFDYGMDEIKHTEIFVFPVSKWMHYIDLPFI